MKHGLWLLSTSLVANLALVVFHRFASGALGTGYADLAALLAVTSVVTTLQAGVNLYLTRVMVRDVERFGPAGVGARLRALAVPLVGSAVGATVVAGVAGFWLVPYLHLASWTPYACAIAYLLALFLLSLVQSALQSLHAFTRIGVTFLVDAFSRVTLIVIVVRLHPTASGAVLVAGATALFAAVAGGGGLRFGHEPVAIAPLGLADLRPLIHDAVCVTSFSVLCYLDIVVAKHVFSAEDVSRYARAALVGKSFLYSVIALAPLVLPRAARARERGEDGRGPFLQVFGGALALQLMGLAFVWWQTGFTIRLLCGADPANWPSVETVRMFCLAMIPVSMFHLTMTFHLGSGSRVILPTLAGALVLYAGLLATRHERPEHLIGNLAVVGVIALIVGIAPLATRQAPLPLPES